MIAEKIVVYARSPQIMGNVPFAMEQESMKWRNTMLEIKPADFLKMKAIMYKSYRISELQFDFLKKLRSKRSFTSTEKTTLESIYRLVIQAEKMVLKNEK